jgi:L-alanine-DL-glutamate epimerase-like enolase superfamily enzyme
VLHYASLGTVTDDAVARVMGKPPATHMWDNDLGGMQIALFDVVGKANGVPVSALLGNKVRDWVPISWWSLDAPPEDWAAEAAEAVANGYTTMKLKPRPWFDIVEQVEAIADVVPPHFKLDLDPNATWQNAANAVPLISKLKACRGWGNVAVFESPIPQTDIAGNQQIKQIVERPIAMHFGSPPHNFNVRTPVADMYVIGGSAAVCIEQSAQANEAEIPHWLQIVGPGLTTVWAAHLGSVLPACKWPAITCYNIYDHSLLTAPITVVGGFHEVPTAPGLGVEVCLEAVERYRVPQSVLDALKDAPPRSVAGVAGVRPVPRIINTIVYPDGAAVHMSGSSQGYGYFSQAHATAYIEGVTLRPWRDDGSEEWNTLWERVQVRPSVCLPPHTKISNQFTCAISVSQFGRLTSTRLLLPATSATTAQASTVTPTAATKGRPSSNRAADNCAGGCECG